MYKYSTPHLCLRGWHLISRRKYTHTNSGESWGSLEGVPNLCHHIIASSSASADGGQRRRRCQRLHERRESGQRCPRARHVVDDDLAAVQAHDGAALRLRVRVAGVVANGLLALPRLAQRVVDVRIVVDERVRIGADALVFAFRVLRPEREEGSGKQRILIKAHYEIKYFNINELSIFNRKP